jgi:hypothetical protein
LGREKYWLEYLSKPFNINAGLANSTPAYLTSTFGLNTGAIAFIAPHAAKSLSNSLVHPIPIAA